MAFLIVQEGPSEDIGKTYVLGVQPVIIGRKGPGAQPDIALDDPYVSRRHAEIFFDEGRYALRDLGSTNGTIVDDTRVEAGSACRLVNDALIALAMSSGKARVSLRFTEMTTLIGARMPVEPAAGSGVTWLTIERGSQEVWIDGSETDMSRKEYDMLTYLLTNAGRICSKDELIANVWSEVLNPGAVSDAAIDQLVHRLRLKIEPDPRQPTRIVSRKGFGYILMNR